MKQIIVKGIHHGNYSPDEKSFIRDVDPSKHLLKIFGNSPAHRQDGWEEMTKLDVEKYYLNENGRLFEANWQDVLAKAFPWRDQVVIPKNVFSERTDVTVVNEEL